MLYLYVYLNPKSFATSKIQTSQSTLNTHLALFISMCPSPVLINNKNKFIHQSNDDGNNDDDQINCIAN